MFDEISHIFSAKEHFFLFLIIIGFILLHFSGLHIPYHQDEYKWVQYSHPELVAPGTVPHPPLTEFIYTRLGPIVGDNNFRSIPFAFGIANLFLIFYLARIIFDPFDGFDKFTTGKLRASKTALWTTFLFTISFYSLLASLMVDVDGAVMPFFLLILFISYYKLKERDFKFQKPTLSVGSPTVTSGFLVNFQNRIWLLLLIIGAVGGFLVKVITALPILALAIDLAMEKRIFSDKKKIIKSLLYTVVGAIVLVIILVLSKFIFPFFNLEYSLKYWEHFINFGNRGWFQTFIQFVKSILYSSPLLMVPLIFFNKTLFEKTRPLVIFVILELITYLLVFDFSVGALDRYLQFLVVPLCLIVGAIFSEHFYENNSVITRRNVFIVFIVAVGLFSLQFINQSVPSLYPKTAWISRILSLKWNFLYVFSGGSGPFPFYVSFVFIALSWIICVFFAVWGLQKKEFKKVLFGILIIGLMYNAVFAEEYLFGEINGSAKQLLAGAVGFIKNDPKISKVVVYNDNGGYEIQRLGKYEKRLYTSPEFNINQKIIGLNTYKDFYLELNIPRIDPSSVYRKYLDSCLTVYKETDKYISAIVYDCRNAPVISR